jgi:hypothetical protein
LKNRSKAERDIVIDIATEILKAIISWMSWIFWIGFLVFIILRSTGVVHFPWVNFILAILVYWLAKVLLMGIVILITLIIVFDKDDPYNRRRPFGYIGSLCQSYSDEWEEAFLLEAGNNWKDNPEAVKLMKKVKRNKKKFQKIMRLERDVCDQ